MYVVLCVFVCMLCVLFARRVLYLRKYKLPPLADGALPLVGHAYVFRLKLEVILDIDDGLTILNSCLKKDKLVNFFEPWFGDQGLVTADETIWKKHRRILGPIFSQKVLDSLLVEMNKYSKQAVEDFAPHAGNGEFNQMEYMTQYSFHTICATTMGVCANENDKEIYLKCFKEFMAGTVRRMRKLWYHIDFIYKISELKRKQDSVAQTMHDVIEKIMYERKQQLNQQNGFSQPNAFLDMLLAMNKDGILSDSEVRQEIDTFIVAGADTTRIALTYVLTVIGTYPDVQEKIYQELYEVFGDSQRDVTKDDLVQLKYTEAVIKETLRLYPIVFTTGRIADKDVALKNYVIPAGSRCFPIFYLYLRDPVWGANAAQFVPERWVAPDRLPRNHHACAAAFGMGKRACIGMNYAMMSMKTCIAHLLRHYRLTGDVTKLVQRIGIIITPSSGHHISIEMRKKYSQK